MSKLSRKIQFARERGIHVFDAKVKLRLERNGKRLHYVLRFPRGFNPNQTGRWWAVMRDGDIYPTVGYTRREAIHMAYQLALEVPGNTDAAIHGVPYASMRVEVKKWQL